MRKIYLILYYGGARYLPKSTSPLPGRVAKHFRSFLVSRIFANCGSKLVVEKNAYSGNGRDFSVGHEVEI